MSFAYTLAPFLSGEKSRTRREWIENYARSFKKGDKVIALNKNWMYGGKRIAIIQLTADPFVQNTSKMNDDDYRMEGFLYLEKHGLLFRGKEPKKAFDAWKAENKDIWVVDFKIIEKIADFGGGK
jgi:hypothetical protein